MKSVIFVLILTIVGCEDAPKPRVLSSIQVQYMESLPIEQKVFMEDCLSSEYRNFHGCQTTMYESLGLKPPAPRSPKAGNGVLETAVGTAAGIGAAKIIFGK